MGPEHNNMFSSKQNWIMLKVCTFWSHKLLFFFLNLPLTFSIDYRGNKSHGGTWSPLWRTQLYIHKQHLRSSVLLY